jgi:SAM-dependent methyltransferase
MLRYPSTTAELNAAESAWWAENGDLEDSFSWVQTPGIQRILRGHYLKQIAAGIPPSSTVLEMGCGTGWLSVLLAQMGAGPVVGIDGSPEQVERAQAHARAAGMEHRTRFELAGSDGIPDLARGSSFGAVIMHGFLHHLSTQEIREALAFAARALDPGRALVVLEPVLLDSDPADASDRQRFDWIKLEMRLRYLPVFLANRGLRRMSESERLMRERLDSRPLPEPPFGPSPKEVPFTPGELERILEEAHFRVDRVTPALCMSHLVAQDILLARLSQPRIWGLATWPILALAAFADRRALGSAEPPAGLWVFNLYWCTRA